ncbi:DNA-binding NarL/FixJ family response regulator [Kineococcus xinjiangensis]|uniref:DNA-binding NarL/FixJ family response regulator n=1 Tax=Kineococcus xinjiangensis TaxID=512762 RepID=A0A2S6IUN9_9ACTN|nr:response regulator transcription factor [Kineococcus xinjiangensis]PPK97899.1 DNA-binding NarL/FixJ family response regulator [Kineococcus xinjiangensis]
MSLRILVVDDERLVRAGFRMILGSEPGLEVVGEAADGAEAVAAARALRPDVVLMDVRMPRVDGIEATRRIVRLDPAPAVLVVTTFDQDEHVYAALRAGAGGFLLKDAPEAQLVAALRTVAEGVSLLAPSVTRRLVESLAPPAATGPPVVAAGALHDLTPRELDVLRLLAAGLTNSGIAGRLGVGDATVKTHVSRVLAKLGLVSRSQAVVAAYESGLVRPGGGGEATGGPGGHDGARC